VTFENRVEAGQKLAVALDPVLTRPCVVTAIPRGGLSVALPVVERFRVPLAVAYARKLTSRLAPEFAFGALDEDDQAIIDHRAVAGLGLSAIEVEEAKARTRAEIKRRMALYGLPPLSHYLPDAAVILVDDGLATGLTMEAALAYARRHRAARVVVAVPCASAQAAERFRRAADAFVSLIVDEDFVAVGEYYEDFAPVTDEEVVAMVGRARVRATSPTPTDSTVRVSFTNGRGWNLAGILLEPPPPGPHPVVVFAHGRGSGKDSPRNRVLAEALRAEGIAAFLFDFSGDGDSEGVMEESTLGQQDDDLAAALDVLKRFDEIDTARIGVAGASSGAAVALDRAAADPRIRVLALRSANPAGAEDAAGLITTPTMLVVGEHDLQIREANEALLARLRGPKRLEVVEGGDHLFEDPVALRRATAAMVSWLTTYLR
jgi:predicted phosphoribosyltransferase/dienelactone hydrolase